MKNQNKSIGVALKVFHKKSDLQNYEGTYHLHKKGSIYPDTYNNVCSVYEAKKRLAKTFLLDIKNVEAYITKDNIHLYYEFMSDEDLLLLANANTLENQMLTQILRQRGQILAEYFPFTSLSEKLDFVKTIDYKSKFSKKQITIGMTYFGVKDTLKPIDEYIAEIKASKEYQEYMATSLSVEEKRAYRTGEMPNSPNYKKQCAINRLRG